jgi:site-specific recombinase XerC
MANQLLMQTLTIVTIQDFLGHARINITQRYCRVSNRKVQKDYQKAMDAVVKRQLVDFYKKRIDKHTIYGFGQIA